MDQEALRRGFCNLVTDFEFIEKTYPSLVNSLKERHHSFKSLIVLRGIEN